MAFTLYSLLQAALLCVNAIAVLHEERFLKNSEWAPGPGGGAAALSRAFSWACCSRPEPEWDFGVQRGRGSSGSSGEWADVDVGWLG